jgi:hypothetical protein
MFQLLDFQFDNQGERKVRDIVNRFLAKNLQQNLANIIHLLKKVKTF